MIIFDSTRWTIYKYFNEPAVKFEFSGRKNTHSKCNVGMMLCQIWFTLLSQIEVTEWVFANFYLQVYLRRAGLHPGNTWFN